MTITPKALKQLAEACRKAGIKHFKNAELEFTLTDEAPLKSERKAKKASTQQSETGDLNKDFKSELLSQEALLFWSAMEVPTEDSKEN